MSVVNEIERQFHESIETKLAFLTAGGAAILEQMARVCATALMDAATVKRQI